jgi:hypothetical protein
MEEKKLNKFIDFLWWKTVDNFEITIIILVSKLLSSFSLFRKTKVMIEIKKEGEKNSNNFCE